MLTAANVGKTEPVCASGEDSLLSVRPWKG